MRQYFVNEHSVTNVTNEKPQVDQVEEAQIYQVQFYPSGVILFLTNLPLFLHFACLYVTILTLTNIWTVIELE